jgi:hypothetical protein
MALNGTRHDNCHAAEIVVGSSAMGWSISGSAFEFAAL